MEESATIYEFRVLFLRSPAQTLCCRMFCDLSEWVLLQHLDKELADTPEIGISQTVRT